MTPRRHHILHLCLCISQLVLLLGLTSCASQQHVTTDTRAITAKIEAHIKAGTFDETTGGTLYLRRGAGMQLSLTKFGIEGARVIFTPDSIFVINKMNNTYISTSFQNADSMMGGMGLLSYTNLEQQFWNGKGIQENVNIPLQMPNTPLSIGELQFKLHNVKPANDWSPNTTVSAKYKQIALGNVLQNLLKQK